MGKKVSKKVKRYNKKRTKRKVNYKFSKNKRKIRKKYKTRKQKRIKSDKSLKLKNNYDGGVLERLINPTIVSRGTKVLSNIAGPGGKDAKTIRTTIRSKSLQNKFPEEALNAGLKVATNYIEKEHE